MHKEIQTTSLCANIYKTPFFLHTFLHHSTTTKEYTALHDAPVVISTMPWWLLAMVQLEELTTG